jgi:hypothetical protein
VFDLAEFLLQLGEFFWRNVAHDRSISLEKRVGCA